MADTAQPVAPAAETARPLDPIAAGAQAFKVALGQAEPARKREPDGRFAKAEAPGGGPPAAPPPAEYPHPDTPEEDQEIEAPDDADEAEAGAESQADDGEGEEAADEAQPSEPELPAGWPKEKAQLWEDLSPDAQSFIRQREGELLSTANARFMEAANVRKAAEAHIAEANTNRETFLRAADDVLAMVQPSQPPASMLDIGSSDYDPDSYHLQRANYEQATQIIAQVRQQRDYVLAQHQAAQEQADQAAFEAVETQFRPKLFELIPDITSPEKAGPVLQSIARYAVENGIPESVFSDPNIAKRVSSPELSMVWKAMQFDKLQAAKGRVMPKAQKAPTPSVRAGVRPTRSSVQAQQYSKDSARLAKSGSIEDGASVWKHFLKE